MAEQRAEIVIAAPIEQVYALWSHFNDYPKFMTYVREVTYLDAERSHWVVDIVGVHEWDAINEGWEPGRAIGWRSLDGDVPNRGRVTFAPDGGGTRVVVEIAYTPPGGVIGTVGDALGAGGTFARRLQRDLEHFAEMVRSAPPGALDPTSSSYLFHADSAAARGATTDAQDQTMGADPSDTPPSTSGSADVGGLGGPLGDPALAVPQETPRVPGTSTRDVP